MPANTLHLLRAEPSTSQQTPRHGLHGWIEAFCLARAVAAKPLSVTEALGISATAFRAYFFDPDDNYAYREDFPGVDWLEDTLELENFGAHEALAAHTGSDIRLYDNLKRHSFLTLVRHELEGGRPLLLTDPLTMLNWVVIGIGELQLPAVNISAIADQLEPDDDHCLRLSLSAIRPTERPFVYRPAHFNRVALGWAAEHLTTKHELFHILEVYVASGARALRIASATCDRCWGKGPANNPAFASFFGAWVEELAWARDHAVRYLAAMADPTFSPALRAQLVACAEATAAATAAAHQSLQAGNAVGAATALRQAADAEQATAAAMLALLATD